MTKHTPGPWEALKAMSPRHGRVVARGHFVADCSEANARLIAAAPDMFEVVRKLAAMAPDRHIGDPFLSATIVEARAAIAKATGERHDR